MARVTLPGHDQSTYRLRMEWGPTGAEAVPADFAVVVDVLSFTTTLSVALERGIEVFPFRWKDSRAAEHAVRHGATLAVGRFEALSRGDARHVSLSPASLAEVDGVERLVLPSPTARRRTRLGRSGPRAASPVENSVASRCRCIVGPTLV